MIKPVNTPKINGVVCSKTGVKALLYEENTKKRVARHFFTYMEVNKLFIAIFNLFKGAVADFRKPHIYNRSYNQKDDADKPDLRPR